MNASLTLAPMAQLASIKLVDTRATVHQDLVELFVMSILMIVLEICVQMAPLASIKLVHTRATVLQVSVAQHAMPILMIALEIYAPMVQLASTKSMVILANV
jgi:hypothetical protein